MPRATITAAARQQQKVYKLALVNVGCGETLGRPSKMPCPAYSTPAAACPTGSKLAQVPGSVCEGCYAMKGNYTFNSTQAALQRRLDSISRADWVDNMVITIGHETSDYFRWHDSGDIQNLEHLRKIAEIARRLPHIKFWLPTREYTTVLAYVRQYDVPDNLIIRVSAAKIDGAAPFIKLRNGHRLPVSYVHHTAAPRATVCPAPHQGNKCQRCRHCWGSEDVSYSKH